MHGRSKHDRRGNGFLLSRRHFLASTAAVAGAIGTGSFAQASDFSGMTITLIVGFPPGGGVDNGARLIARHLPRFLKGNPNVVVQNMPGAGGVLAADHLYARAPKDGLTLGVPGRNWPLVPLLGQREVRYQPLEFEYIGSSGEVNSFVWIKKSVGVNTPDEFKARDKPVIFGSFTPDTEPAMVPKILSLEGFPTRIVTGYQGTAAIITAMERGEIDGIATNAGSFARRPDVAEKTVRVLQLLPREDGIPLAADQLSDEGKSLLQLATYASATGMPLVAPPQSPPDRIAALRAAFQEMGKDSQFAVEAEKIGEPHGDPVPGERVKSILEDTVKAATPEMVAKFRKLAAQTN